MRVFWPNALSQWIISRDNESCQHYRFEKLLWWLVPSQWETSLQSNAVSHWLGANLESALMICPSKCWHILVCKIHILYSDSTRASWHPKHWLIHCLFNTLVWLTTKEASKVNNAESDDDAIMTQELNSTHQSDARWEIVISMHSLVLELTWHMSIEWYVIQTYKQTRNVKH